MHPRAAKKAEKGRQRAEDHQRRLAEEKSSRVEQPAKSRSRRSSPRRESRPEGRHPSPRRHRAGKDRSDRKRRQKSEEKDQLTMEEEEELIRVQLEEVQESPAVKEQIAQILRESYRERFGTYPEPSSSSKMPSRSHKDPVDELDDLPSSELDELEEKYGQSIEVTSEGQARLKGSEKQEKERREKAKACNSWEDRQGEPWRTWETKSAVQTNWRRLSEERVWEREALEKEDRERKEAKAIKEINPKKEELRTSAPVKKVRPNPPEDVPHWINASDGSLKTFREVHQLSQRQQDGKGVIYVSCLRCQRTIRGLEPYSLWAHIESKGCYPESVLAGWRKQKERAWEKGWNKRKLTRLHRPKLFEKPRRPEMFHHRLCHRLLWDHQSHCRWETLKSWSQERVKLWKRSQHSKWKMCPRWKLILFGWSPDRGHHLEDWKGLWREQRIQHSRAWAPEGQIATEVLRKTHQELSQWAWFLEKPVREEKIVTERDQSPPHLKKELARKKPMTKAPAKFEWLMIKVKTVKIEGMIVGKDSGTRSPVLIQKWISSDKGSKQQPPQPESSKAALNVVWATVDSGAATSCLPVELCQERGLAVERTSDLPYTNASGAPVRVHGICHPKVTIGNQDGSKVAGTGMFKAMDVAKPLLSVARLVNKGWEVCFKPGNSYMKFQDTTIPLEEKGGVYKIPLNLEGFQGHRAG